MGLKDKYCIVGVGETEYSRHSGRSTRAMAVDAIKKAMADAGLGKDGVDGMMSYQGGDSTPANWVSPDLGLRLNFYMDVMGGGSSTEALIGLAIGAIEAGMCHTVALFRSMNGYSDVRIGGTGARAAQPVRGLGPGPGALRHAQRGAELRAHVHAPHVRVRHHVRAGRARARRPQQARLPEPEGAPEGAGHRRRRAQLALDREAAAPPRLLSRDRQCDRASSSPRRSARAICGRSPSTSWAWPGASTSRARTSTGRHGPISRVAGYYAKDIVFGQAGIKPEDVDITGSYDAFTFTTMLQLEEYGFCKKGEGGQYVSSGIIELGGRRPNNTSGSHLCEGYTHGMSMVIENTRQLRGTVDDYCPGWAEGKHSYDYSPKQCRQVKDAKITMNLGWAMPATGSALILHN